MNWFKQLFDGAKKDKTRQNLLVSIDDPLTGDHEVLTIKTTSTPNIIIEFNGQTSKMSVNPKDLQDAMDRIKAFMDARGVQPATLQALGARHLEAIQETEQQVQEVTKAIEKKFDLTT